MLMELAVIIKVNVGNMHAMLEYVTATNVSAIEAQSGLEESWPPSEAGRVMMKANSKSSSGTPSPARSR